MKIFGSHDDNTIEQFKEVMQKADAGALMADGHYGYYMPVGGVAGYENQVSPYGVGFDIACGNKAVKLDIQYDNDIKEILPSLLDLIAQEIEFGVGRVNKQKVDHELFDSPLWQAYEDKYVRDELKALARKQLGTVGSGNHYVDIFVDTQNYIWIGVHFGSRGLGHKTCTGFMNLAINGDWNTKAKEKDCDVLLQNTSDLGERYLQAMELCGMYAYAGRDWVVDKVVSFLQGEIIDSVHNHHNYAWMEEHQNKELCVVRKGATPAFPNQRGFIGGSMGDDAVIIEGVESPESAQALYSTVHGAGRVMSRTRAAGKVKWKRNDEGIKRPVRVAEGEISQEMLDKWIAEKGVLLRGGGLDESPHVYRRLTEVLKSQGDTIRILETLTPIGVVMAGADVYDPYKD